MEKAKQSKHLIKEKNSNLKEIEDLRQKRETYEIHKMKVTFKINLVLKKSDRSVIHYVLDECSKPSVFVACRRTCCGRSRA